MFDKLVEEEGGAIGKLSNEVNIAWVSIKTKLQSAMIATVNDDTSEQHCWNCGRTGFLSQLPSYNKKSSVFVNSTPRQLLICDPIHRINTVIDKIQDIFVCFKEISQSL